MFITFLFGTVTSVIIIFQHHDCFLCFLPVQSLHACIAFDNHSCNSLTIVWLHGTEAWI